MRDYLNDPAEIYRQSFAAIRAMADLSGLPASVHGIAERVIHSCGMTDIVADLRISADLPGAIAEALKDRKPIFTDSEMVRHGIIARMLPAGVEIVCTLNDEKARELGLARKITRSAAAVSLWLPRLRGAVVVIGNAPTALFALLEALDAGADRPAAIVGFPVGFIGASESKDELAENPRAVPFATLLGRRGGSAMASSVVNAVTADMTI
ncbi:precorrin-8X methylmutase [Taklimakanibacter deserti]|uniref:precorrin-8X methylmutase n=1 Tax=Taklimakanibacter deserti TaxID=2267839 RepID=UPI000E655B14